MRPFDVILFDLGGVLIELTGSARLLEWATHIHSTKRRLRLILTQPMSITAGPRLTFGSGRVTP